MSSLDLSIESPEVLRLIQAHLVESGLHESCQTLQDESGVKILGSSHGLWKSWAIKGDWGSILTNLHKMETRSIPSDLLAETYEVSILELAEQGHYDLAYATLRQVSESLDRSFVQGDIPLSRLVEQRIAALAALRHANSDSRLALPKDYYGGATKEARRKDIGSRLLDTIPQIPKSRMLTLLHQAVKWQSHTGQLSVIKEYWQGDNQKAPKKRKRRFDLVLGETNVDYTSKDESTAESVPTKPYSTISFGKKATCECAVFLPDASGLVTGSSDGLVEIWDPNQRFKDLRTDLPYQQKEELLGHDDSPISAMVVSNDGTMLCTGDKSGFVKVWKIEDGKCLRSLRAHQGSVVSCIDFSHDGSHILTASHDTTIREHGLRSSRLLKEFRGHTSFVNVARYMISNDQLRVVSAAADGTVRIWDGKSSECLLVMKPSSLGASFSKPGTSIAVQGQSAASGDDGTNPNIHTLISMHSPPASLLIVPRGRRAYLVALNGTVQRVFQLDGKDSVFVAAAVSPSNCWLYGVSDHGVCHVYDLSNGEEETSFRKFAEDTCTGSKTTPEITGIFHHPHKGIMGAFSTDKSQKKGTLTLWK